MRSIHPPPMRGSCVSPNREDSYARSPSGVDLPPLWCRAIPNTSAGVQRCGKLPREIRVLAPEEPPMAESIVVPDLWTGHCQCGDHAYEASGIPNDPHLCFPDD